MGSVWVARHLQLETQLAIKFIDPSVLETADVRVRFEREAKAAALLQGPNVVQVHDYGIDATFPYLVMELLRGEDLGARLQREERLSLPAAAVVVQQVARVLRKAHDAGIVHRDLKPSNVFLVAGDDDDEPLIKVLDFGVAKAPGLGVQGDTTRTGTIIGSPRYMSPEQARGSKTVDHRSDLWSLAVIAFRAVTGELPYGGDEIGEVILSICTAPAPAPSSIAPDLDAEVDRFFAKALAADPDARFQTAREFAQEFSLAAGLPPASSAMPSLPRISLRSRPDDAEVRPMKSSPAPAMVASTRPLSLPPLTGIEPTRPSAPNEPPPLTSASRSTVREGPSEAKEEPPPDPPPDEERLSQLNGTLTHAPGSVDIPSRVDRLPAPRGFWGGALLIGAMGVVLGGSVALHLLAPGDAGPASAARPAPLEGATRELHAAEPAPPPASASAPPATGAAPPSRTASTMGPRPVAAPSASASAPWPKSPAPGTRTPAPPRKNSGLGI